MPPRFHLLIATQFVSALADNALLILTIAWMQQLGEPGWWVPLLKVFYLLTYVLLAPLLGPLADGMAKSRLMLAMGLLKCFGAVTLAMGAHPLLAYAVVGLGAAAYAPAKYGLITEQVTAALLVRANAWIEVSVIAAVLLGTVLGGFVVSQDFQAYWAGGSLQALASQSGLAGGTTLGPSLLFIVGLYALAAIMNLGVRDSGRRYVQRSIRPFALLREFRQSNLTLWRDREGGLSMSVTVLCWGAGGVLQFAVLRWAVDVLGLGLDRAAYLQAVVAIGVACGASLAGRWTQLSSARRLVPVGVVLGLLVALGSRVDHVLLAGPVMMAVGFAGGLLIVPMNALLQHRGHQLLTAGRSIAVQGFNENLGVLLMLGVYALLLWADVPIAMLLFGFGVLLAASMALLTAWLARSIADPSSHRSSVH